MRISQIHLGKRASPAAFPMNQQIYIQLEQCKANHTFVFCLQIEQPFASFFVIFNARVCCYVYQLFVFSNIIGGNYNVQNSKTDPTNIVKYLTMLRLRKLSMSRVQFYVIFTVILFQQRESERETEANWMTKINIITLADVQFTCITAKQLTFFFISRSVAKQQGNCQAFHLIFVLFVFLVRMINGLA